MTQAQTAAERLAARADDRASEQIVTQLVRCAQLSQDAARTLEWAADTLRAHGGGRADRTACQLLHAARARLDASERHAADDGTRTFAWL